MQSTAARVAVGVVAVAIVVAGFIALSGGDGDDSTTATTSATTTEQTFGEQPKKDDEQGGGEPAAELPVIEIKGGEPVGGVQELTFEMGETIAFEVESADTSGEIHMHGYDVAEELEAGGVAKFSVPADIEGVFEVEIEDTAVPIAEITVNP